VAEAANAGEARPAAIAVCSLPLTGELIDFAVSESAEAPCRHQRPGHTAGALSGDRCGG
jgi:hypothetical protein